MAGKAAVLKEIEDGSWDGLDGSVKAKPRRAASLRIGTACRSRLKEITRRKPTTLEDFEQKSCTVQLPPMDPSHCGAHCPTDGTKSLAAAANLHQQHQRQDEDLWSGWLYKTTRPKWTNRLDRAPHEPRQHRRFRLTEHSLEYSHLLQRV